MRWESGQNEARGQEQDAGNIKEQIKATEARKDFTKQQPKKREKLRWYKFYCHVQVD